MRSLKFRKYTALLLTLSLFFTALLSSPQQVRAVPKIIILTSGTSWTVPADFNPSNNTIEAIGGGGGGGGGTSGTASQGRGGGGAGGGGEYRKISNFNPSGGTVSYTLGSGGGGGGTGANGTAGTDTVWNGAALVAKGGGAGASNPNGGAAGAGGTGGTGAAGAFDGGTGGAGGGRSGASGGGGGGGGGAGGTTAVGGTGATGVVGGGGAAGGAGGAANGGTAGSGGGVGGNGSAWTETESPFATAGAGGGGGGGASGGVAGGNGGTYGAGGGGGGGGNSGSQAGGAAGNGIQGVIVITYEPLTFSAPSVTQSAATSITATTATLNGNITDTGGANATVRGFATSTNSALSNGGTATSTESGSFGTGAFTGSLTGLTGDTTYYFRAYATNPTDTGYADPISNFLTLPDTPGTPTYTATIATTTGVTWTEPTGGTGTYQLNQCINSSTCSLFTNISSNSTTTYSLAGNTTYEYAVRGNNATGNGAWSATSSRQTVPDVPGTPTYTNTTATTTGITWTVPTGGADTYKLNQCQGGSCTLFTNISSNSTTTYSLIGHTTYEYAVLGTNETGDGYFVASSTILTVPGVPGTPTFSNVNGTTLTVSWTAPTGGSASSTVERCTGAVCTDFAAVATNITDPTYSYNDSGLSVSTTYRYRVKAHNNSGESLYSAIANQTTNGPPSVDTDPASSVTISTATLNGEITATGGLNATSRGFASSTNATLSSGVATTTVSGDFGTGTFTGTMGGLSPNTRYYFRAFAENPAGIGYGSILDYYTLPDQPGTPTYTATIATTTGVTWTAPTGGADSYKLNQCSGGTCSLFTAITSNSTTTYSLTGNTTYDYAVRATNATGGDGVWSATSSIQTVPGSISMSAYGTTHATTTVVNWTVPTGGTDTYKLNQCQGGSCTLFTNISSNSTTTYSLIGNTTYSYTVLGTNETGDGYFAATTTQQTLPDVPTMAAFSNVAATTLTVNWNAPTGGADTYKVERCLVSSCSFTEIATGVSDTFYNDSGLSASTNYRYRVRATNETGDGLYSNTADQATISATPGVDTNAATNVTALTATLNGDITSTGGSNATVRGFASSTNSTLSSGVATSTESGSFGTGAFTGSMGGLTGHTTYYFRAYATNPSGTGYGSILSFLTLPDQPGTPTYENTIATTTGLTWNAPTGGAASYILNQCSGGTCSSFSSISSNSTTTYSLTGNTNYDYAVRGVNATGNGVWSATSTVLTRPGTPTMDAYSGTTATTTVVNWTAPTGGVSTYKLNQCEGGSCTLFTNISGISTTTYSLTGNTTYSYSAQGSNATGDGYFAATTTRLTLPDVPGTPTFDNVTSSSIRVSWSAPTGGAASYKVERCTGVSCTDFAQIAAGVSSPYTDNTPPLDHATTYRYRVRATNATGDGLYSGIGTQATANIAPTVTTNAASSVATFTATLNGEITATGGENATARGFASSTNSTLSSGVATSTESGSFGTGAFTGSMGGLTGNTTYYFRAFATNSVDTGYGSILNFLTLPDAPGTPTYSSTIATTTVVEWTAPTGGADTYKLNQCSGGTCSLFGNSGNITGVSTTTYSLTGNTSYDYALRATNATGEGVWSATSTVLTRPGVPGTPTFSNINPTTMRISWTAPTGDSASSTLERCTGSGCTGFSPIGENITHPTYLYDDTGLSAGITYRYRVKAHNNTGAGLYSEASEQATANTTTLADGSDPGNVTLAPGGSATDLDAFTLTTSGGTDNVTALTVTLSPSTATTTITKIEVTNTSNTDVCTDIDVTGSTSNILNFTCSGISFGTGGTSYKVRITPKTHANMPAVPGVAVAVTGTVTSITATNSTAGTDTDSATVTIDNASPSNVTSATATAGNTQVTLSWTNPGDSDLSRIMVVASTSAVSLTPTEGGNYATSTAFGSGYVACYGLQTTCTDTSLANGTAYHYKIYAMDANGNFSETGVTPTGSPATPTADASISQAAYRWRNDNGSEGAGTYVVAQNTPITTGFFKGDTLRLRLLASNSGGTATGYTYRLEHASSSCSAWMTVPTSNTDGTHWHMFNSNHLSDGEATTDASGVTNPGGMSFIAGSAHDLTNETGGITLATNEFTELEYSLKSTFAASDGVAYCFRVTNAGSATNFTYTETPTITLATISSGGGGGGGYGNVEDQGSGSQEQGGSSNPGGTGGGAGGGETGGTGSGGQNQGGGSGGGGGDDLGLLRIFRLLAQGVANFASALMAIKR